MYQTTVVFSKYLYNSFSVIQFGGGGVEVKDFENKGKIMRNFRFQKDDMYIRVEGYQYYADEEHEFDVDYEPMGDYFYECFNNMKYAILKCAELLNKGWEVVTLEICPVKSDGDDIYFRYLGDLRQNYYIMDIDIDLSKINKSMSDKLAKIKNIVEDI